MASSMAVGGPPLGPTSILVGRVWGTGTGIDLAGYQNLRGLMEDNPNPKALHVRTQSTVLECSSVPYLLLGGGYVLGYHPPCCVLLCLRKLYCQNPPRSSVQRNPIPIPIPHLPPLSIATPGIA